jgi:hypothetical protein
MLGFHETSDKAQNPYLFGVSIGKRHTPHSTLLYSSVSNASFPLQ